MLIATYIHQSDLFLLPYLRMAIRTPIKTMINATATPRSCVIYINQSGLCLLPVSPYGYKNTNQNDD